MNEQQTKLLYSGGVDARDVLYRLSGSEEIMNLCLQSFLQDRTLGNLQSAIAGADRKAAFAAAHALKGISANMGLFAILKQLSPIVEQLRTGAVTIPDTQLTALSGAYEEAVDTINCYFRTVKK